MFLNPYGVMTMLSVHRTQLKSSSHLDMIPRQVIHIKGTDEKFVNFYGQGISRAQRQWPGGVEAIDFFASMPPRHCLDPLKCPSDSIILQFSHRVPFNKEEMPWCPCPFKNIACRPVQDWESTDNDLVTICRWIVITFHWVEAGGVCKQQLLTFQNSGLHCLTWEAACRVVLEQLAACLVPPPGPSGAIPIASLDLRQPSSGSQPDFKQRIQFC